MCVPTAMETISRMKCFISPQLPSNFLDYLQSPARQQMPDFLDRIHDRTARSPSAKCSLQFQNTCQSLSMQIRAIPLPDRTTRAPRVVRCGNGLPTCRCICQPQTKARPNLLARPSSTLSPLPNPRRLASVPVVPRSPARCVVPPTLVNRGTLGSSVLSFRHLLSFNRPLPHTLAAGPRFARYVVHETPRSCSAISPYLAEVKLAAPAA